MRSSDLSKYTLILAVGILFGIILSKAEVISWFRIYEMFRFKSFHMYGVIGSAVAVGIILVQLIKRRKIKTFNGEQIIIHPKQMSVPRYLFGGIIFGLGWALVGACPGPMFVMLGRGITVMLIVILSGILGTLVYGMLRDKLPH
ncbi:MAG: YeeE/YedE family protein [Flavobacteriales bacterium]|nr:YeeE/YedE family protein [Flavobacteriales bacterium]